jgi:hypothetical protein
VKGTRIRENRHVNIIQQTKEQSFYTTETDESTNVTPPVTKITAFWEKTLKKHSVKKFAVFILQYTRKTRVVK